MQRQYTLDELIQFLLSFALVVVPVFFIPDRSLIDPYSQPRLILLGAIASALLLIFLFNPSRIIVIFKRNPIINTLVLIYILILTYSLTYSLDLELSLFGIHVWKDGYIVQLIYFAFFFAAQSCFSFDRKLLKVIVLSGTLIAFYGVFQSFGIDFMRDSNYTNLPVTGGMYNQNFLGSYLVLLLPISIYLFLVYEKKIYLFSYFLMYYALLGTLTRGAWIGFFASLIFLLMLIKNDLFKVTNAVKKMTILIFITFLALILFSSFRDGILLNRILSIFTDIKNVAINQNIDDVGSFRGFIWIETIKYISVKPLQGYGIQNIMIYFLKDHQDKLSSLTGQIMLINNVHNEYLQIAVSTGIPSLVIIACAAVKILLVGLRKISSSNYLLPILIAIIGYLVQYFFSLSFISNTFILYIMLGSVLSEKYSINSSNKD